MFRHQSGVVGACASGVVLMLLGGPVAFAGPWPGQDEESASAETAMENADYKKKSLGRLRKEFNSAEEDFYALFNTVNSDDEFDVVCKNETPLGSRKKVHACKAAFLREYEAEVGSRFNDRHGGTGGDSRAGTAQIEKKLEQLRAEISAAVSKYPELQQSFAILVRAKKDYEAKQQDR